VRALFDAGPYLGDEALEAGLVDGLAYRDELDQQIRERVGEGVERVTLRAYLARAGRPGRRGTTVALIQGDGPVTRGKSAYSLLDGSSTMGADTVAEAFRDAIEDKRVKAIVFRVNSPGGSYVASDTIWRETVRAHEAGKPVIVSMGNLAASGGYFVALDAQRIVAEPGTITASIGVLGGKLVTRGFWDKIGVTFDEVATSEHSTMWSSMHDFGPARSRFEASLDRIYEDFTRKVAAGRGLELDEVRRIARGRIWTGEDALELGLVDELGGMSTAYRAAREELGLEPDAPIRVKRFPARRSPFELLFDRGRTGRAATAALARALAELQPTVRLLQRFLPTDAGPLSMPELQTPQ
jgi:protease-4